jgi:hypothetical protein
LIYARIKIDSRCAGGADLEIDRDVFRTKAAQRVCAVDTKTSLRGVPGVDVDIICSPGKHGEIKAALLQGLVYAVHGRGGADLYPAFWFG